MIGIREHRSIEALERNNWNSLVNPDFPFADYDYFLALEKGGSVGGSTGWEPIYLTAEVEDQLVGASYLFLKGNSYGEYIFDWAWAEAYQRHNVIYYPKLLSAIPFTPATGPKLLFKEGADRQKIAAALIGKALVIVRENRLSSLHYLFLTPEEVPYFEQAGLSIRHSFQYHWTNHSYRDFEDFLSKLKSRKRKQILKERRELPSEGIEIATLTGNDLGPQHAKGFYEFYLSTIEKMGAIPYLTLKFFQEAFQSLRHEIVLYWATKNGEPVAASLCYQRGKVLYGRYWGAREEIKNLHFELCYYRPIELAISRGLERSEAGAQGEHKIPRGFLPTLTYSAHHIEHPAFRQAIQQFIDEEKTAIGTFFVQMESQSPFTDT